MNSIGGYFELELRKTKEFHPKAIAINTGKNALEIILKIKKFKKVYIPYYTCDVVLRPFKKTKTLYEFYSINKKFEPVFDFSVLKNREAFFYINYFGLKDSFIKQLVSKCKNLVIDNSQAFFSKPLKKIPTFYSCRKFFGVPDGAYLYLDGISQIDYPFDYSEKRFTHLLNRIEYGAEAGYNAFKKNDEFLANQPTLKMSKLTKTLLGAIDYENIKNARIRNYQYLHDKLFKINQLDLRLNKGSVPMVYPLLTNKINLRQKLINNKIYTATYWPNVLGWVKNNSVEYKNVTRVVYLPIDQRYSISNMEQIIKIVKKYS